MLNLIKQLQDHISSNITDWDTTLSIVEQMKQKSPRRVVTTLNKIIVVTNNAEEAKNLDTSDLYNRYEDLLYDVATQIVGNQVDKIKEVELDDDSLTYEVSDKLIESVTDPDFETTLVSRLPIKEKVDKRLDFTPKNNNIELEDVQIEQSDISDELLEKNMKHFSTSIPKFVQTKDLMIWNTSVYVMDYMQTTLNHFSIPFDTIYPGHIVHKQTIVSIDRSKFKKGSEDYRPTKKFEEKIESKILSKLKKAFNEDFYIFWFKSNHFKNQMFGWCVPISWMVYKTVCPEYLAFPFDCKVVHKEANVEELRNKRKEVENKITEAYNKYVDADDSYNDKKEEIKSYKQQIEDFNKEYNQLCNLVILDVIKVIENKQRKDYIIQQQNILNKKIEKCESELEDLLNNRKTTYSSWLQLKKQIKE